VDHEGVKHRYIVNPDPKARAGTIYEYFKQNLDRVQSFRLEASIPQALPTAYLGDQPGLVVPENDQVWTVARSVSQSS
jgi:hypothetical protein